MKKLRLILAGVLGVTLLVAASSALQAAAPDRLRVMQGSIGDGQSVRALATAELTGTDDSWSDYIEFVPNGRRHYSLLALEPRGSGTERLEIVVGYRGPDSSENRWTLDIGDREAGRWVTVFANEVVDGWIWTRTTVRLKDPGRFLDGSGRARLRYRSSNATDVSQLDVVSLTLANADSDPVVPEPSPPVPNPDPSPSSSTTVTIPPATPTTSTTSPTPSNPDPTPSPSTTSATPPEPNPPAAIASLPVGVPFDYQIGGAYDPPAGTGVVSRDWHDSQPLSGAYNICYVNAFQTQPDADGQRIDETANWPPELVLTELEDPGWAGEFLIDISTEAKRQLAAEHVGQMTATCASKGYDAVEFDNLDSWTRLGTTPFDQTDTVAYASLLVAETHDKGLAAAQKNTAELIESGDAGRIGFDLAVVEECGTYNECDVFADFYNNAVVVIEYDERSLASACDAIGDRSAVVRRDRNLRTPAQSGYVFARCDG